VEGSNDFCEHYLEGLKNVLDSINYEEIGAVVTDLREAYDQGKQVFVVGNGGSAATASHMACDLGKTVLGNNHPVHRKRFKVIALNDNMPLMTAWGNDVSYELVFSEQLRNLANRGDVLLVITGSGNSPNVLCAVQAARELDVKTIGFLGFDGGRVKPLLDRFILVKSDNYGFVEDAHMILNHLITAHFKKTFQEAAAA
jgi:D-sedoheptulose 7-phosphate isomerase